MSKDNKLYHSVDTSIGNRIDKDSYCKQFSKILNVETLNYEYQFKSPTAANHLHIFMINNHTKTNQSNLIDAFSKKYASLARDVFAPMALVIFLGDTDVQTFYTESSQMWPIHFMQIKDVVPTNLLKFAIHEILRKKLNFQYIVNKATSVKQNDKTFKRLEIGELKDEGRNVDEITTLGIYIKWTYNNKLFFFVQPKNKLQTSPLVEKIFSIGPNIAGCVVDTFNYTDSEKTEVSNSYAFQNVRYLNFGTAKNNEEIKKICFVSFQTFHTLNQYTTLLSKQDDSMKDLIKSVFDFSSFVYNLFVDNTYNETENVSKQQESVAYIGIQVMKERRNVGLSIDCNNYSAASGLISIYTDPNKSFSLSGFRRILATLFSRVKNNNGLPKEWNNLKSMINTSKEVVDMNEFKNYSDKQLKEEIELTIKKMLIIDKMKLSNVAEDLKTNCLVRIIPSYSAHNIDVLSRPVLEQERCRTMLISQGNLSLYDLFNAYLGTDTASVGVFTTSILARSFLAAERMGRVLVKSSFEQDKEGEMTAFFKEGKDDLSVAISKMKAVTQANQSDLTIQIWSLSLGLKSDYDYLLNHLKENFPDPINKTGLSSSGIFKVNGKNKIFRTGPWASVEYKTINDDKSFAHLNEESRLRRLINKKSSQDVLIDELSSISSHLFDDENIAFRMMNLTKALNGIKIV